jgi:alkaline phosphatase D
MTRRQFLAATSAAFVTRDAVRPAMPSGVQSGDVTATRAIIWSRSDRPARMFVEVASNEAFRGSRVAAGPAALDETGLTARLDLGGLAPGEPVFYRVWFEDLARAGVRSAPIEGRLRTAPRARRDLTVVWTGDTVGQGWGINPDFGGLRLYEAMAREAPDLFVHSGDMIYADNPLRPEVALDDGTVWRNVITPAKEKVAETLDDFRGNYAYNLADSLAQRFNAQVPMLAQWDDHEVMNNWYLDRSLERDARYTEKSMPVIAARAKRAMFEYVPIRSHVDEVDRVYRSYAYGPALEVFLLDQRSYRGPNSPNRQPDAGADTRMLGPAQLAWLKERLLASRATWKLIASDMPLGLQIRDGQRDGQPLFEAWANGDGPPLGRELELADLFAFTKRHAIHNLVWITADVHYAAAHYYSPNDAIFKDFLPFWEFVGGPMHAGTFNPVTLDPTFGPAVKFVAVPPGMKPNRPPSEGLQFYGRLRIDGRTDRLAVSLHNLKGERVYAVDVDPR